MGMRKTDRVKLRTGIEGATEPESWDVIDMTLKTFGLPSIQPGQWGNDERTIMDSLSDATDEQLIELADHYGVPLPFGLSSTVATRTAVRSNEPTQLKMFASHMTKNKVLVHGFADELGKLGVELFVAHDDIHPTDEWVESIEDALRTADAALIFYHPGIKESFFCQQEVGWILSQGTPHLGLKVEGQDPMGMAQRKQAMTPIFYPEPRSGEVNIWYTAGEIIEVFISRFPNLHTLIIHSLAMGLNRSKRFEDSKRCWELINKVPKTPALESVLLIEEAIEHNSQVREAYAGTFGGARIPAVAEPKLEEWKREHWGIRQVDNEPPF